MFKVSTFGRSHHVLQDDCHSWCCLIVCSCWRIAQVLSDWFSPVWSIWNVYSMGLLVCLLSETQGRYDACQNTCTYFFCNLIHWWGLCIDAYHGWADVSLLHKSDFIMFSNCWHSEAKTISTFESSEILERKIVIVYLTNI